MADDRCVRARLESQAILRQLVVALLELLSCSSLAVLLVTEAEQVILTLPRWSREIFSSMDYVRQLSVLRSILELSGRLEASSLLDRDSRDRLDSAIRIFTQECSSHEGVPKLTGAIAESTTTVEGLARRMLSKLAYACLGDDKGTIQKTLKLNTATIRKLSLGQVVAALQVATGLPEFAAFHDMLTDEWLRRTANFAEQRNLWLHDPPLGGRCCRANLASRDSILRDGEG